MFNQTRHWMNHTDVLTQVVNYKWNDSYMSIFHSTTKDSIIVESISGELIENDVPIQKFFYSEFLGQFSFIDLHPEKDNKLLALEGNFYSNNQSVIIDWNMKPSENLCIKINYNYKKRIKRQLDQWKLHGF